MDEPLYSRTYHPLSLIFREGEAGDAAYVIERGKVEITARRGKREVVLAKLGKGELFGEMALIEGQLRTTTARSLIDTRLIVIHRSQVKKKVDSADPVLNLLFKGILERLRHTNILISKQEQSNDMAEKTLILEDSFIDQVREQVISTLRFEQDLRVALKQNQFELYYQPIVSINNGGIGGVEALIRWNHPKQGMISPGHFIRLAEETGLIVPIGLWVLEESCSALQRLMKIKGNKKMFMSINLSGRQIAEQTLVEEIRDILERTGTDPSQIKLEVTESVLMDDPERAALVLNHLKMMGMHLAIDDFGTGYSSLSYLNRFPFDVIKVDRSFVSTMLTDISNFKIVRAVTTLAKELNMQLVAEGVEQEDELNLIREFGCEYVQGFYFSRPLTFEDTKTYFMQNCMA